jgi:hypothetical protein
MIFRKAWLFVFEFVSPRAKKEKSFPTQPITIVKRKTRLGDNCFDLRLLRMRLSPSVHG